MAKGTLRQSLTKFYERQKETPIGVRSCMWVDDELCLCHFDAYSSGKEAGPAVNGAPLGGIKGNRSLLSTLGALDRNFDSLSYS